ncbi:hypothetical protein [Helicobacter cetorum]|uniref:Uncharacterized protein n=1 Tax=Helicobacter cetorum (strain ATCC BAA-429 / MIT 00-7128) TaxID=182217 RepID=I0ELM3_HELC0|nr:hypothetical protein [Helicobacter cetorum]AFI03842.1 hypothetical protein HCW_02805 [Helicobacter cetorum MIT 00-7128]
MIRVNELVAKIRKRLNDEDFNNYLFSDEEILDAINSSALEMTLEFRLNRQKKRAHLSLDNPSIDCENVLSILSVYFDNQEILERTSIERTSKQPLALLICDDRLSITPYKDGFLEVVYCEYLPILETDENISLPKVCEQALTYASLCLLLETPTNESNFNKIANYQQLLKNAKNTLSNYLNAIYSKNISFSKVVKV